MGRIKNLAQKNVDNVYPIKYLEPAYDIKSDVCNRCNLTLSPINFPHKFIGRTDDIDNILQMLNTNNLTIVVNGIGGIGKTSVCKYMFYNYADKLSSKYDHIAWVNYDKSLSNSFVEAFKGLNIPFSKADNLDIKFDKIVNHLNKLGNKLLIFIDDVTKSFRTDKGLSKLLKSTNHVIITSRRKIYDDNYVYPLGFLSKKQCIELFLEHYRFSYDGLSNEINSILPSIIELSGFHSLTIELLAKSANLFNDNTGLKLSDLKKALVNSKFDLSIFNSTTASDWDDRFVEATIAEHIQKVFSISCLTDTQKESLFKLSLLAPSSLSILKAIKILDIKDKHLNSLVNMGWITSDNDMLQMHSCIKFALNKQLKFPMHKYRYIIGNINSFLEWKENHTEISELITHAEEVCYRFRNSKFGEIQDVQHNLANYFKYQGDFKNSINYMKRQMTRCNKTEQTKTLSCCQKDIATMYIELNNYNLALKYIKMSLQLRKKLYHPISFEIAECYAHIGFAYQEKGEYEKALTNYKKALDIRKKLYGSNHVITAWSYNNMAILYCNMFDYDNALLFIDKAIVIRKKAMVDKKDKIDKISLDLAQSENIKGYILLRCGSYDQAYSFLKSSLFTRKKYLGENHLYTYTAYERFALVNSYKKSLFEAEEHIERALSISYEKTGNKSIRTAIALNTFAIIKRFQNLKEEAINLHHEALNIFIHHLGSKNVRLSLLYEDLANTHMYFRDYIDAKRAYEKAYTLYKIMKPYPEKKCQDICGKIKACYTIQ